MCGGADLLGGGSAFEAQADKAKGRETRVLQQLWTEPGCNAVKEKVHHRRAGEACYGRNIMWDGLRGSTLALFDIRTVQYVMRCIQPLRCGNL